MKLTNEAKVGLLIISALTLTLFFAWIMGATNPFKKTVEVNVTYNFAGGIEVGSPVRVSGIKVGKVERIDFFVPDETFEAPKAKPTEVLTPLRLRLSVDEAAAKGVRKDSKFYINIAGIIGERYVEITPGSVSSDQLKNGDTVRGIDPPRIDQLISQSFDLAGEITKILQENEGDITKSIQLIYKLSKNINKTLDRVERSKIFKTDIGQLINNLIEITGDLKTVTSKTRTKEGQKTLQLMYKLLWRLEPLDKEAIQKFFQKEGIRTRLF